MVQVLVNFALVATLPISAYLALGRVYLRGTR